MNKVVLVVAAHSDDESLGCGGTIARHVAEGWNVHVAFMTDGVSSRKNCSNEELISRGEASHLAMNMLGVTSIHTLNFPDNQMDSVPLLDVIKSLEELIESINPSIIYTHHYGDLNIDHQITHTAVMTACRPLPNSGIKKILTYEVLSSTEWCLQKKEIFHPNTFIDIDKYLNIKLLALKAYSIEMRLPPHARSESNVENLAKYRGNSVGLNAAEAFMLMRYIS